VSDLQLGLLGIGVIVVVAVIAYNKWQEIKLRRRAEAAFASGHRDVLFGERAEAVEGAQKAAAWTPAREVNATDRVEHTLGDAGIGVTPVVPDEASPSVVAELDTAIDLIVELECARPVAAQDLSHHTQSLVDETLAESVRWEGRG